jgi:dihydrofolate synthase/folylpolyglutamate synthase
VVIGDVDEELAGIISEVAEGAVAERVASFGIDFGLRANTLAVGGRLVDIYDAEASYSEVMVPLHGPHQGRNAAIAVAAANAFLGFSLGEEVIDAGMDGVRVPGRLEVLGRKPLVIVDGAHNPAGAQVLAEALIEGFQVEGSRIALIGMLEGRDPVALLEPLTIAGFTTFFVVQPASPRAMELQRVDEAARSLGATATPYLDLWEACDDALTAVGENGMVLATGSLYVVGPARLALREIITKR